MGVLSDMMGSESAPGSKGDEDYYVDYVSGVGGGKGDDYDYGGAGLRYRQACKL